MKLTKVNSSDSERQSTLESPLRYNEIESPLQHTEILEQRNLVHNENVIQMKNIKLPYIISVVLTVGIAPI